MLNILTKTLVCGYLVQGAGFWGSFVSKCERPMAEYRSQSSGCYVNCFLSTILSFDSALCLKCSRVGKEDNSNFYVPLVHPFSLVFQFQAIVH